MESQPRASGGETGKSSDDIVYELADMVINTILTKIQTDEANINLFKVNLYKKTHYALGSHLITKCKENEKTMFMKKIWSGNKNAFERDETKL